MRINTNKIATFLLLFIPIIILFGCKEDYYDPYYKAPSPFTGVPDDFDWSTISSIKLTVNVNDEYNGQYYYVVEVFNDNPVFNPDATLLAKGVAKQAEAYTSEINFPQALQTIYIRQTAPNGLQVVQERTIDATDLSVNFAGKSSGSANTKVFSPRAAAPTYSGDRTNANVIDLKSTSQTLTSGKSYVITGGTYSGNIVFWGGQTTTLFVEGEWNVPVNQEAFQDGMEIVVLNGGKITFSNSSQTIYGYNNVNLFIMDGGAFNPEKKSININFTNTGGNIYNAGSFYLNVMQLNGGRFYNNSSTVNIAQFTQTGTIENHGVLTMGSIDASNGLVIDNYCNMSVTGGITTSGGTFILHNSTILSCVNFDPKGTEINMEAYSLFDVTGTATFNSWSSQINGPGSYNYGTYYSSDYALTRIKRIVCNGNKNVSFAGNIELECSSYKTNGNGIYLYSPAHVVSYGKPSVLIPASECTGSGSYPQGTTPTDPTFPIEVPTNSIYTYAIEDLWPAYGDYDMNDLVLESQTSYTLNRLSSTTSVSSLTITAKVMAVGAFKKLGAAFQLDQIPASNVTSISVESDSPNNRLNGTVFTVGSTGVETGQNKAVIPLFDEAHHFLNNSATERYFTLNTEKGDYITPKQVRITINFKSGTVSSSDIAVKYLNFFVVTDGKTENRKEVHLVGYNPTDKAITSYFGGGPNNIPSNNDLSLNGVYYRGTDNLIWGLMIPGTFSYPSEYSSILKAYPKFKSWATSGGTTSQDWYSSSNADQTYIYTK
ncbi:LruC domain-containing protein [Bacteroides luti]|uniref:LruC domain-containing protein n=1 Tax=Bacteroides luti TaxID=1297750 RepID=A0A1M5BE63_9BACE|nr:LruC domain-containing protein [Bacteroides luti]SHF40710.1 LruC domain-containing protein [Bacteroides luti]